MATSWKQLHLVFCHSQGGYLFPTSVRVSFERLLRRAKIPHTKFHALRHNASLILRKLGIDSVVRREMLGHNSLELTDVIYGHATQEMHQQAAKDLGRMFENSSD
jgi:integrase